MPFISTYLPTNDYPPSELGWSHMLKGCPHVLRVTRQRILHRIGRAKYE
jgi:hypothetical protein